MAYVSLYRKWRPQTFEEVIGQEYVTRTLSNSLRNGNFAHAYLFSGPRGTGKTSTARILAKALNCELGPTPNPCNRCDACREITEGTSVDVVEIDAASTRGIDSIRELRERVIFSPAAARIKVYVLDEAHMLTKEAFNAFLKTLEEPPPHVVFVLATTEPHKMPPTILSRCQRYDFRSVPVALLVDHLARVAEAEGIEAREGALRLIARRARGSARDALVILEQVMSYGDGVVGEADVAGFLGLVEDEMLVELGDHLVAGDASSAVALVERAYEEGRDLVQFAREAQEHFRRVFLLQHAALGPEDLEVDETAFEAIRRQATEASPDRVFHFIMALREAVREMQATTSARVVLEGTLIAMARIELDSSAAALAARLGRLEVEMERMARSQAGRAPTPPPPVRDEPPREERLPDRGRGAARKKETGAEDIDAVTPASGPAQAAVPAGDAAQLDLTAVRKAWPLVKERVKERKITTHAFLLEGKPVEFAGGELCIAFPADRSFHRGELEKGDHRKVLEEALAEVLGAAVRVRTRLEKEEKGLEAEPSSGGKGERERKPDVAEAREPERKPATVEAEEPGAAAAEESRAAAGDAETAERGLGPEIVHEEASERRAAAGKKKAAEKDRADAHDAGKVKLVKDVFGAEMIEEIKLGE
ncbi:MAG: DNA polymerase III subunit gamma/tau [Actinomycetota bacterium]